jgi:hypothetical protein
MYVRKAIENLLQHKEINKHSHHELKLACQDALLAIKTVEVASPNTNNNAPSGPVSGKSPFT